MKYIVSIISIIIICIIIVLMASITFVKNNDATPGCIKECKNLQNIINENEEFAKQINPFDNEIVAATCRRDLKTNWYDSTSKEEYVLTPCIKKGVTIGMCDCIFDDDSFFMDRQVLMYQKAFS